MPLRGEPIARVLTGFVSALVFLCVTSVAEANIIDLSGNGETVAGSITTDGTFGTITALANITAWSFMVSGAPFAFSISSADPSAFIHCESGTCSLNADAAHLSFDFASMRH